MKVVIIGAGALGSLFAAKLSPLAEVRLVSSWLEQVQAIQGGGLRLTEVDGSETVVPVRAVTPAGGISRRADLALICVKSGQTEIAAGRAAGLLKTGGLALTLQNGLGNLERIAAALGEARAVQGVTSHGATLIAPGWVRHAGAGSTALATRPQIAVQMEAVQALFNRAGFETRLTDNLDSLLWGKLIINVGINALTAILQAPNGLLAESGPAAEIMTAAVLEAVAVAQAKGIALPYDDPPARARQAARATAANRSSMLADVTRKVKTEVEVINGAVVREGQRLGIPTPVNQTLARLVQALEQGYEPALK